MRRIVSELAIIDESVTQVAWTIGLSPRNGQYISQSGHIPLLPEQEKSFNCFRDNKLHRMKRRRVQMIEK
jgi:hypothetical protein